MPRARNVAESENQRQNRQFETHRWRLQRTAALGHERARDEGGLLRVPGQHRIDPHDERVELRHVVPQEFRRRVVRDLAVISNQAGLELYVGLHGIHLR